MWQERRSNLKSNRFDGIRRKSQFWIGVWWGCPRQRLMQYAYLQLGQDAKAKALIGRPPRQEGDRPGVRRQHGVQRCAATCGAARLEGAAQLQAMGTPFPAAEAITHFARAWVRHALVTGRSGSRHRKAEGAARRTREGKESYWAEQIEVSSSARSWLAWAGQQGRRPQVHARGGGLEDGSEKHVAMENRLYPMRELLGDMLREHGQPGAALKECEVSMKTRPTGCAAITARPRRPRRPATAEGCGLLQQACAITRTGDATGRNTRVEAACRKPLGLSTRAAVAAGALQAMRMVCAAAGLPSAWS